MSRSDVEAYWPDYGAKGKLVTAAGRVDEELGAAQKSLLFIVDADWAPFMGPEPIRRACLLTTDYPAMEHYYLETTALDRFLTLALTRPDLFAADVRVALHGALGDLMAGRMLLHSLHVAAIEKFVALCDFSSIPSVCDSALLVERSVNAARQKGQKVKVSEVGVQLQFFKSMLVGAPRSGRGHDIAPLLIAYLGLKGSLASVEVVERLLRTSVRVEELAHFELFKSILMRVRSASTS